MVIKRKIQAMNRNLKSMLGVTLLEIMLVLAIAAMVIVMSIRYYQSASSNQRVAAAADLLTGYIGGAESYVQAGGSFASITASKLATYSGVSATAISPWGQAVSVSGTTTGFTVNFGTVPSTDCTKLMGLLKTNTSITFAASCTTATVIP